MQNSEYWEKRFILLNEMLLQKGENYFKSAQKSYADVMENIEKDINDFYMKFAHENNITFQQAKQILTTSERQAFQMKLEEYIKYGSKNGLSKEWMKKLKNASTVHRVTRLQALQYQFRQQIEKLEAIKEYGLTNTLKDIYKEGYYRTAYEIQRASGIGSAFSRIDERKIEKVLAKPWAADGKNFSERIWGQDRTQLLYQLENRFSQGMIRGESPQKIIKDIAIGEVRESRWGHKKLSSAALDYLFNTGILTVADKRGTQKYFDLTERVLDSEDLFCEPDMTIEEFLEWYIERRIQSVGFWWNKSGGAWQGRFINENKLRSSTLQTLVEKNRLEEIQVEGIKETFYLSKEFKEYRKEQAAGSYVRFIAPLDNIMWDRQMLEVLFGFDVVLLHKEHVPKGLLPADGIAGDRVAVVAVHAPELNGRAV